MSERAATVIVQPLRGYANALLMTWQHDVRREDVAPAFAVIMARLSAAQAPLHVVVDITHRPSFPLQETVAEALKPFRHDMMGQWLVVGHNRLADMIEFSLRLATGRQAVQWFETRAEALAYLDGLDAPPAP